MKHERHAPLQWCHMSVTNHLQPSCLFRPTCMRYRNTFDVGGGRIFFPLGIMTSSNGNIFRVTGPLCWEFTGPGKFPAQRPVTGSFDVFFGLRPNKRLSNQPWGWWFETPSWSLWRHCNGFAEGNEMHTWSRRYYPEKYSHNWCYHWFLRLNNSDIPCR